MKKTALIRKFQFKDIVLDDPNPSFTPDRVMSFYSQSYPELTTANVGAPESKGDTLVYKFVTSIGDKG